MEFSIFDGLDDIFDEVTGQFELPKFIENDEIAEFAPSMEVQAKEISEFFCEIEALEYDNWKELNISEKLDALTMLEKETAEIAHRPSLEVSCEPLEEGVFGYCDGQRIVISENILSDHSFENYKEVLDTVFHEGRHGYQFYNLLVERVEKSEELVESWRINQDILGYKDGSNSIIRELGFFEYYTQPVEVDARFFAETVLNELDLMER